MKNITIKLISFVIVVAIAQTSSYSIDRTSVKKIREQANNASSEDWYTLAESADKFLSKEKYLEEAKSWILQSIEISERPYNLMLLGDYYRLVKYPEKAMKYYVEAIRSISRYDEVTSAEVQRRIAAIIWPDWKIKKG